MTTNHTSAPWIAQRNVAFWEVVPENRIDESSPYTIADVCASAPSYPDGGLQEANARLIAAAPELLEALKWYVSEDDTNENYESNGYYLDGLRKAKQAIKKATGEQNV
jgi:hypothetical protein